MCRLWRLSEISVLLSMYFKRTVIEEYLGVGFGNYLKCNVHSTSNVSLQHSKKWQNFLEYLQHQNLAFQVLLKYNRAFHNTGGLFSSIL